MNTRSPFNFGLAGKIETRLQEIQSGRDLASPAQERTGTGDMVHPANVKVEVSPSKMIGGLPAEEFESQLAALEEKAALSGGFDPEAIAGTAAPTSTRMLLLTRLLPDCTTQPAGERISWILKQNRRRAVITQLVNNGTLQQALLQPLPPTDELGKWLRRLLQAQESVASLESLNRDELLSLAHAVEALNGIPGLNYVPELSDIVRHLDTGRLLADYDILLLNGFFGREKELSDLQIFLEKPKTQSGWWEGILLTGMGGAGKSTLLAKFIRDQVTRKACTVAVLDFDRPAISPEDTTWLEMELSRQVGQQYPDAGGELSQLRKETRLSKSSADEYLFKGDQGSRSAFRSFSSIVSAINQVLTNKNAAHLPFLLVLDTFEEVAQRNLTTRILSWLSEIGDRLYPITLKVIISGRLFESALRDFQGFQLQQISVNELDPIVARQLLVNMGLSDEVSQELVVSGNVPLRPLELKLLGRVILSDPDFSLQTLTDGLQTNNPSSQQLFVGIVYRRVLLRITDEVVRTLACPGLVLHYVTKDLIQQVLAPALKMAPLSDEQANNALNTLAGYEWLAHRETDGSVWHSRDIRRMMLKVMIAYEPEKTKDIHEHAIRYFSQRTTPNDRGEVIYHRLMLVKDPQSAAPDKSEIISVSQLISPYLTELPKTAGVFVKYVQQGHIDYEELVWMPDKYRDEATDATGQFLCDNREWGHALMVVRSIQLNNFMIAHDWVIDTLVATGEWELFKRWFVLKSGPHNFISEATWSSIFFADGIIGANLLSPETFQQRVTDLLDKDPDQKGLDSPANKLFLARAAFRLVSIHGKQDLQEDCVRTMRRVIENVYSWKQETITTGVIRNFFLLNMAIRDTSPVPYLIDLSLLNLESSWLKSLLEMNPGVEMDAQAEGLLQRVLAVVEDFSRGERKTVEGLLSRIDDLRKYYKGDLRIILRPDLFMIKDLLRFTAVSNAEFRDPCRFALLEAFPGAAGAQQLAEIISSLMASWHLDDLALVPLTTSLEIDAEHALENCIELIDRCGKLKDLLRAGMLAAPYASKLQLVMAAYTDWEDAIIMAVTTRQPWDTSVKSDFTFKNNKIEIMKATTLQHPVKLDEMIRLGDLTEDRVEAPGHEPVTSPEEFEDRAGYDPAFLDGFHIALPMPTGDRAADVSPLLNNGGSVLKYHHFSVIMSKSRRMPMLTAVNINGEESRKVPRISVWSFDGRMSKDAQWGDALYFQNDLDRGHMVRREDPVWGTVEDAKKANSDTFHFTNSCPQMAAVNQKTWVGLENHVLSHARADGMRVTVFTGPIFSDTDMDYRDAKIPKAFWKVVAIVTETGRPSATAYKVSQEKELEELEFVYAGYKTYQISIKQVIKLTDIDLNDLLPYDGFSQHELAGGEELNERLESLDNIRI